MIYLFYILISLPIMLSPTKTQIVTMNMDGHKLLVTPLREALVSYKEAIDRESIYTGSTYSDFQEFNKESKFNVIQAKLSASKIYPRRPLPIRGEFETLDTFKKRCEPIHKFNDEITLNRTVYIEEMRKKHKEAKKESSSEVAQESSKSAYLRVKKMVNQHYNRIIITFPTTVSRYDIDNKRFEPLPFPSEKLGGSRDTYFAEMHLSITNSVFHCRNVDLARKIRKVSESGDLWGTIELMNAEINISIDYISFEGNLAAKSETAAKNIGSSAMYMLTKAIHPDLFYDLQFYSTPADEVPNVIIKISAESSKYINLYDAESSKVFFKYKN